MRRDRVGQFRAFFAAPLHDIIVLKARYCRGVEIMGPDQGTNILDMNRRKRRGQPHNGPMAVF